MRIERDLYLKKLINRMHNGLVKVITGIRRSGKSYLLSNIFKDYLLENDVDDSQIILIELDNIENEKYRDPHNIINYINEKILKDKMNYIFIDEIQMLDRFEEVLNSLMKKNNLDIYVTGSNSQFLSNDIITQFRGRGDEIHIYPLTFAEYMSNSKEDVYNSWIEYSTYGGLPLVSNMKTDEQKILYLRNLFQETYIKDIKERHSILMTQELNDIIDTLASSIGTLTNPSKIHNTFVSKIKSKISLNTIRNYIDHLKNAFLISEAKRYDVKRRKYIGTPVKYYFEDIGLRNARLNFRQNEPTHIMENIIYNELRVRDYNVDIGVVNKRKKIENQTVQKQLEVDFIASLGSKKYYVQSAYSMPDDKKIEQEKASLLNISDSFKKIIIVQDMVKKHMDENGILTMNLFDFLLNNNSLDE